jgi:hypothetical protein
MVDIFLIISKNLEEIYRTYLKSDDSWSATEAFPTAFEAVRVPHAAMLPQPGHGLVD